jgi:hypothetical protein
MTRARGDDQLQSHDIWEVSHVAGRLMAYGCYVSAQHLEDNWTRMQFNRELAYYTRRIVNDVEERRLSKEEGLLEIRAEKVNLMNQTAEIASQLIGLSGGLSQVYNGLKACAVPISPGCIGYGMPSLAHGLNNVYENGRNLSEGRNDVEGGLKKGYQKAAVALGYTEETGTKAYLLGDIALSAGGMTRLVPKADAWRLFRYLRSDKEMAVKQMSNGSLTLEIFNNIQALRQMGERPEE